MLKFHRDALKTLRPIAEAEGAPLGDLQFGGKHGRLPCTRGDGSQFHMTLPLSPSCVRAEKNIVKDFRQLLRKNSQDPL